MADDPKTRADKKAGEPPGEEPHPAGKMRDLFCPDKMLRPAPHPGRVPKRGYETKDKGGG
jgi:hypothetical protein